MTDTVRALYDYVLENRFSAFLTDREYHTVDSLVEAHLDALRRELPQDQRERLDKLWDALGDQRGIELEAMFQAAWAAARELA
ncbi:DUF6809 family protein [Dysosmobacter sp.]|uniref:DUF6809 family protein n=1 Tax=Dysosmobacter sp. TaxID=2591382 RepID=UPI002A8B0CDC|nr:DUF6809 family protein [Dysosmobacter sp.]MDY3985928.1 hypothetical protein [Dysosmobacter sp.]